MSTHLGTPDYHIDHPTVYPPSEDTFLLLDALEKEQARLRAVDPLFCVEIGCGSGVVSAFLNKLFSTTASSSAAENAVASSDSYAKHCLQFCTICTDVNVHALHCTQKTFDLLAAHCQSTDQRRTAGQPKEPLLVCCNLLDPLSHRLKHFVDILLMNPPYVPTEQLAQNEQELCYAGGLSGRELIDRLLPNVARILSPNGLFYLVALKENDINELISTTTRERLGIEGTVVIERQCRNEHLFVIRFARTKAETPSPSTGVPPTSLSEKLAVTTTPKTAPPSADNNSSTKTPAKITIHARPVGGAPQLKNRKMITLASNSVAIVNNKLRSMLGIGPSDSLYLFVNESFALSPEHNMGDLYECFGSHESRILYLQYCLTPAWG